MRWRWSVLGLAIAAAACNPDPRGRCNTSQDCTEHPGDICTQNLCEAPQACTPACDAGATCVSGLCNFPGIPSVGLELAANALLSPSSAFVPVVVVADDTVTLGQLTVAATAADGGVWASGLVAQAAIGDGGVSLTSFSSVSQGPATLAATLDYTDSADAGHTVSSSTLLVRIDAVSPTLTLGTENLDAGPAQGGPVDGWFARSFDGGITIDALIDDTPSGSGPDGGTLTIPGCTQPGCTLAGALSGAIDAGAGLYQFTLARTLAAEGSEGPLDYSVDGVDNAGNHVDQTGSLLIDGKAPVTGSSVVLVNPDAGTLGADGQLWFPAGTNGVDVEVALPATDEGVGVDYAASTLTVTAGDFDPGQPSVFTGFQPPGGQGGSVHFILHTGITSDREGPLRFTVDVFDKLGNASAPVAGQILIDDLGPSVSASVVDYTATTPARASVCAPTATCGRGTAGAEDHALRDDVVTILFSLQDCGVGWDMGALPSSALVAGGQSSGFLIGATLSGSGPGSCANGSTNLRYQFTAQIDLAKYAPALTADATGASTARAITLGVDSIGNQGFNGDDSTPGGSGGGLIEISRWRWRAALAGRATGDPALIPLGAATTAGTPRELVVPVDGDIPDAGAATGLEVFDSTGAVVSQIALTDDRATGAVAIGSTGTLWIAGTPSSGCGSLAVNCATKLWAARLAESAPLLCSASVSGGIGALAVRDASGTTVTEAAIASIDLAGVSQSAAAVTPKIDSSSGALTCAQSGSTFRANFTTTTGVSVANNNVFIAGQDGFYSEALSSAGSFALGTSQFPFADSSSGALLALPAAPALSLSGTAISPYFGAVDVVGDPSQQELREAALSGSSWVPAAAPWSAVAVANPVLHTPVFDSEWLYTTDDEGTLQLSSLGVTSGKVVTASAPAVVSSGSASQLVSAPVLVAGNANGSGALLVQSDGLVNLASVVALVAGSGSTSPKLALTGQLTVGACTSTTMAPPAPVIDGRGTGSIAYVIDGGDCAVTGTCGTAMVWALQLDTAPVAASATTWPRPGHDSCNSRQADGACP